MYLGISYKRKSTLLLFCFFVFASYRARAEPDPYTFDSDRVDASIINENLSVSIQGVISLKRTVQALAQMPNDAKELLASDNWTHDDIRFKRLFLGLFYLSGMDNYKNFDDWFAVATVPTDKTKQRQVFSYFSPPGSRIELNKRLAEQVFTSITSGNFLSDAYSVSSIEHDLKLPGYGSILYRLAALERDIQDSGVEKFSLTDLRDLKETVTQSALNKATLWKTHFISLFLWAESHLPKEELANLKQKLGLSPCQVVFLW